MATNHNDPASWARIGLVMFASLAQGAIFVIFLMTSEGFSFGSGCKDTQVATRLGGIFVTAGGVIMIGYSLTRLNRKKGGKAEEHISFYIALGLSILLSISALISSIVGIAHSGSSECKVEPKDPKDIPLATNWILLIASVVYAVAAAVVIFLKFFSKGRDPRERLGQMRGGSKQADVEAGDDDRPLTTASRASSVFL